MDIQQYNNIRREMESRFAGRPHTQTTLIQFLITRADPLTGFVEEISYQDLAMMLTVNPAPGRKDSGTPTKQTIRNYIKSIERDCGDYFQVITKGQKLKFIFPELSKLFNKVFDGRDVNTGLNNPLPIEGNNKKAEFNKEVNTELNSEVRFSSHVKNNNIYIINKHNKQTREKFEDKKLIADDFYPTAETIEEARNLGFVKVTELREIKAFIEHNRKRKTLWADFNPVFLTWLARDFKSHNSINDVNSIKQETGRNHNERSTHQFNNNKPTLADLRKRSQEIIREYEGVTSNTVIEGEYCEIVAGTR